MRQYVRAIWWFLFLVCTSACEQTPESARKELGHLGVAYTPEAFITSLTNNDLVTVQLFLQAGMDPNTTSAQGIPALLIATMNCDGKLREDKKAHTDIAKALIVHGANVNVVHELHPPQLVPFGSKRWTPLTLATRLECHDLMQQLLQHGAAVNGRDESGRTALIDAASRGQAEAVRMLLDAGADVEAKTKIEKKTALLLAADQGHVKIVQMLIGNRSNVNARDGNGKTALIIAAARGHTDIVQLLLEKGADVIAKDQFENTALRNAEKYGGPEVTELLRSAGAS
jgi:ankyrin repeat protein